MTEELQQDLFDAYPEIFAQHKGDSSKTAMCWGIQCPDSWYPLIRSLCFNIQQHVRNGGPQAVAVQVKEKFGYLRFYADNTDPYIDGLIHQAEGMTKLLGGK